MCRRRADRRQIFLACASVDLLALMDQTTLAASLYIIGSSLGSTDQVSWIAGGYFMCVHRLASPDGPVV